jgi:membrane protein implicated in regulation of membrane protease activity
MLAAAQQATPAADYLWLIIATAVLMVVFWRLTLRILAVAFIVLVTYAVILIAREFSRLDRANPASALATHQVQQVQQASASTR